jgi:rhodanese-related sulfurtransferase
VEGYKTITRDILREKIADREENFSLIEVLPKADYQQAHLPRSLNIPVDDLEVMVPRFFHDWYEDIVVYSKGSDDLSKKAAELLVRLGYRNVKNYAEGKSGWIEAGLPVEVNDVASAA